MKRIREIAALILLPVLIVVALVVPAIFTRRVNEVQLEVMCQTARASIQQLAALKAIGHELGLPVTFEVPSVPLRCVTEP